MHDRLLNKQGAVKTAILVIYSAFYLVASNAQTHKSFVTLTNFIW